MSLIRVDFYLLDNNQSHWTVACRLLEKAYTKGHRVYVFCNNQQDAELIDELLWTFKEDSFIPHNLQGEGPEPPPPIQIGCNEPRGFNDILLNLTNHVPFFYHQFKRIIELVVSSDAEREQSRVNYRAYRAKNCELHMHQTQEEVT